MTGVIWQSFVTEELSPSPDGATTDFHTTQAYVSGSVEAWRNGIRKIPSLDDGFTEGGGTLVQFKVAPRAGDTLTARYQPA